MSSESITLQEFTKDIPVSKASSSRIESIGLVGGGVMGRGIAQALSSVGLSVCIVERTEELSEACLAGLSDNMDREIQRWAMTGSEKRSLLSRIRVTTNIQEIADSDFVMEAVDEDFDLKRQILVQLDEICPPETIISSNTSTISLTKIVQPVKHPERIIGMHFSNPVPKTPLCEIIRAFHTSAETFKKTRDLVLHMGKTPVEVYEYPGFITARVIIPMINEAMYTLMEGVANAEDIDTAMRLGFNFPMGPLELADSIGLDELYAWMDTMFHELGDTRYRPCPLLRNKVRELKYGKKSGEGFFRYDQNGIRIKSTDVESEEVAS
jgi:3-hydroxybutyryl-CoA dehydrogenase